MRRATTEQEASTLPVRHWPLSSFEVGDEDGVLRFMGGDAGAAENTRREEEARRTCDYDDYDDCEVDDYDGDYEDNFDYDGDGYGDAGAASGDERKQRLLRAIALRRPGNPSEAVAKLLAAETTQAINVSIDQDNAEKFLLSVGLGAATGLCVSLFKLGVAQLQSFAYDEGLANVLVFEASRVFATPPEAVGGVSLPGTAPILEVGRLVGRSGRQAGT